MVTIRHETREDIDGIRAVNEAAFDTNAEAQLVDNLRQSNANVISLVAEQDQQIVGHILFTRVTIEPDNSSFNALALAPLSVLPQYQNQAIGSALVRKGLQIAQKAGYSNVIVLGHPAYYKRFGFVPAEKYQIHCPYQVPPETFMVKPLIPNALDDITGMVLYHPLFSNM
ncbi:MAG: N-acetyltransferase [Sedimentisphaerales bacterium]|nr:N-acetyltransferase [Sedimentisphaerales bacterium]